MNNTEDVIALTANGGKLVDGKPDYYVDDEVFSRILNDTEFAQRVFKSIGSEEVCIARLGINITDNVFREAKCVKQDIPEGKVRGLGFHERI